MLTRRRCRSAWFALLLSLFIASAAKTAYATENIVRLAAASSMRFILDDLIDAYANKTGTTDLQAIYGSSGNLFRQIIQGAPFDLFLSADVLYIDELESNNRIVRSGLFALGTLVLHSPADVSSDELLPLLTAAIAEGEFQGKELKIAIANPAHAPFGKAAKEVLQALGIWEDAGSHLIIADNVSQAAQFARTGAVAFAFVAQSLAGQLPGQTQVVPQEYYSPLRLKLGVLSASPTALGFIEFIQSDAARKYLDTYKLRLPVSDDE